MDIRYTTKVLRDGGLAAVMIGLAYTHSLANPALEWAAIICGAGAAISALRRVPAAKAELTGSLFAKRGASFI